MNTGGWIILILSVGGVSLLFGWCIYKVMTSPEQPHIHGFAEETPDEREQRESDEINR